VSSRVGSALERFAATAGASGQSSRRAHVATDAPRSARCGDTGSILDGQSASPLPRNALTVTHHTATMTSSFSTKTTKKLTLSPFQRFWVLLIIIGYIEFDFNISLMNQLSCTVPYRPMYVKCIKLLFGCSKLGKHSNVTTMLLELGLTGTSVSVCMLVFSMFSRLFCCVTGIYFIICCLWQV